MIRPDPNVPLFTRLRELPEGKREAVLAQATAVAPTLEERIGELTTFLVLDSEGTDDARGRTSSEAEPTMDMSDLRLSEPEVRALEWALKLAAGEHVGTQIGPYTLLERIGEGGFGTVWKAEQETPVRREVALKILKVGMDTKEVVARFEAERQALALMDHSSIATVFDAGVTETGRPYFVMELVAGIPINRFCDEHHLTIEARLRLFIEVCHAVQHAHQKGIIHRDLKPSNILVSLQDDTPAPKIIDFGIAKATVRPLTDKSFHTQLATFLGTPVYSSPEQVEGRLHEVDTRSDLYSLGVILYELLSGRLPFDPDTLTSSGIEEMRRIVREVEPPRLSTRYRSLEADDRSPIARQRGTDAPKLSAILHGDLDWIVMRCLEKDRVRRYESAGALAADIERFQCCEPILARPPSTAYRVGKFVRRHRMGVTAATLIALLLVASVLGIGWQAWRAMKAQAAAEAVLLESTAEELVIEEEYSDNTEALALAIAALERGDTSERRRLALGALWKAPTRFVFPRSEDHEAFGIGNFSPDGRWFGTGSRDSEILLWPAKGGDPEILDIDEGFFSWRVEFSPSGRWLISFHISSMDQEGPKQVMLWDMATREPVHLWNLEDWAPCWISADETRMLAYSLRKEKPYAGFAWWSIEEGRVTSVVGSPREDPPLQLRFPPYYHFIFHPSADLRWLVSWEGYDVFVSAIGERELGPRQWIGRHEDQMVKSASLSPDGSIVSSGDDKTMHLWSRFEPGNSLLSVRSNFQPAFFDLERTRFMVAGPGFVRLFLHRLEGPPATSPLLLPSYGLPATSPDGNWTVTTNQQPREAFGANFYPNRTTWPFRVDLGWEPEPVSEEHCVRFAADGRTVASDRGGRLILTDLQSGEPTSRILFESPGRRIVFNFSFDPQGEFMLVGTHLSGAWKVPMSEGDAIPLEHAPGFTAATAFSPSGERMALGGGFVDLDPKERYARVLDRAGRLLARMESGREDAVTTIRFLTEDELIVTTQEGLYWWNTDTGKTRLLREGGHQWTAVSPNHFVTRDRDHVWFYDRETLKGRSIESIGVIGVVALAISANEDFIVSRNNRGTIQVVHLDSMRSHLLPSNDRGMQALWLDPKGYWIAAANHERKLSYWPVPRGEPLQDRPLDQLVAVLKAQTNMRAVPDPDSAQGYRIETEPFPGWETTPTWQEWYSEDYMTDPPWEPMLDLEAGLEEGGEGEGEG